MIEHDGDYRPALAAAADAGFDHVELNMEKRFSRDAVDPGAVGAAADAHGLDVVAHLDTARESRPSGRAGIA